MKIKNIFVYIFLFLLTALVLDLANPLFDRPARDGGFFLYAGQQILEGKIPYQDFWDSKGPAIFYINALGLFLGSGSRWGVWFVEFVCIFFTFVISYQMLSEHWSSTSVLFGIFLSGLGLKIVLGYGNYTEEYALFFNALGLLFFFVNKAENLDFKRYFLIAIFFGLSFTFRANNIGGFFAILIALSVFCFMTKSFQELFKNFFVILVGFAVPLLIWALYFSWYGILDKMIHASIFFNFLYSAVEERGIFSIFNGFGRYGMQWVAWVALLGWLIFIYRNFSAYSKLKNASIFNLFLLVWLPIEVLLSNLSGRDFSHYYISWVLAVIVYITFLGSEILSFLKNKVSAQKIETWVLISILIAFSISSLSIWERYTQTFKQLIKNSNAKEYSHPISTYVQEHTQETDLVLTWYPDLRINFMAHRTSPVKYVYFPLFLGESLTTEIQASYFKDLTSSYPELILDCSREIDAIPSLDVTTRKTQFGTPGLRSKMYIPPNMGEINDFVKANYHIETKIDNCIIFRLNK